MASDDNKVLKGFTFFRSYYEAALELPDKQRLAFYDAVIAYGLNGEESELTGLEKAMFSLTKPNLDASRSKSRFKPEPNENQMSHDSETKQNPNSNQTAPKRYPNSNQTEPKLVPVASEDKDKDIGLKIYDDDDDTRAREGPIDPFYDTVPKTPEEAAARRVLLEFTLCGLPPPNQHTADDIDDMVILPEFGVTPESRADLIIRAMRSIGEAPKDKKSWGNVKGLIRYWQKNGEGGAKDASGGRDIGELARKYNMSGDIV